VMCAICNLQSAICNEVGWNHEASLRPDMGRRFFVLAWLSIVSCEPQLTTDHLRRDMSYRYERRTERRRSRNGCLAILVVLVWIVLLAVLAYRYWLRPQVSQYVGRQIAEQVGAPNSTQVNQQIEQGAAAVLPTAVAALPSGELRITEEEANAYMAARIASLKPLDSATIHFVPNEVQADLRAIGTTSTARMGLAVQDGRIIAVNPQLDGPLGQVIALPDLTRSLEQQLNNQLAAQGRRVTNVRVEQGAIVVTIEGQH
jgi:hypothetical protein